MVLQKQQELEVHLQTADEVCRLGQEDSVLLIDALEREDKLRVSSCHIKCGGGGGKAHFKGRGVYQKSLMRAKMQIICFTSDCYYTNRNIFIALVHREKAEAPNNGRGDSWRMELKGLLMATRKRNCIES